MRSVRLLLASALVLAASISTAGPLDDATALVFEWLDPPAPWSDWPAFNAELSDMIATASASRAATESVEFASDRLDYYRKQHSAGALQESALWQHARELVEAKQASEAKRAQYVQALHALSKRWGRQRWWELQELLVAFTGWLPDGCDISEMICE